MVCRTGLYEGKAIKGIYPEVDFLPDLSRHSPPLGAWHLDPVGPLDPLDLLGSADLLKRLLEGVVPDAECRAP